RRRAGAVVVGGVARGLSAAATNAGALSEQLSGANEHPSIAVDACRGPSRTAGKVPRTRGDGVAKVSRYGYPAGSGSLVGRAFGAPEMEKPRRRNDADASRHRRGSSIERAAALSLDPFSRGALS